MVVQDAGHRGALLDRLVSALARGGDRALIVALVIVLAAAQTGFAEQVTVSGAAATDDATIYEDDTDGNSGGWKGIASGQTNGGSPRRALLRFDVAGSLPLGATVTNVELRLYLVLAGSRGPEATTLALHRLTESWVEGDGLGLLSGQQGGGGGGEVVAGTVTWDSREHGALPWTTAGGSFVAQASASTEVGNVTGIDYVWTDAAMAADVQAWIDGTAENDGWILVEGVESGTGRLFNSSEADLEFEGPRPRLVVDYTADPAPEYWLVE